jgi:hypothetical protein
MWVEGQLKSVTKSHNASASSTSSVGETDMPTGPEDTANKTKQKYRLPIGIVPAQSEASVKTKSNYLSLLS